ncbi:hypothetical protein NDU88_003408 [Pleurodeles waltl]|uniref:Uncharacterized protein n=1 Tax=Pleurodeles waltl TaxID=8319 RepID=A0AAV7WSP6_PLEWA|nr:hypothetical protein NDU88_003408 [Pleurodeles waltl]
MTQNEGGEGAGRAEQAERDEGSMLQCEDYRKLSGIKEPSDSGQEGSKNPPAALHGANQPRFRSSVATPGASPSLGGVVGRE